MSNATLETQIHTLTNGIRIVHHRHQHSEMAHCGVMLDIGSRDETVKNQGIAHFWEHMAFKGTRTRKAHHISGMLESLGGEINAFTDKEKIFFHVSIRSAHLARAIDLLADITFNSVFPKPQIQRERNVILEEMAMYADDPEELLHDEFDQMVFANHPLGMNILGARNTLESFDQQDFIAFIDSHLDTRKVAFSCVSNLPHEAVIRMAEKYMQSIPRRVAQHRRKKFAGYKPQEKRMPSAVTQLRCAMGRVAYALDDDRRVGFSMLTHILGGPGIGSRLNRVLREKYGYVYAIGAQYAPFVGTGLFVISFGADPTRFKASMRLIKHELQRLCEEPVGDRLMRATREQALTRLIMAQESGIGLMMTSARDLLDFGKTFSTAEIYAAVHEVTADRLTSLAQDMFDERALCMLCLEPQQT